VDGRLQEKMELVEHMKNNEAGDLKKKLSGELLLLSFCWRKALVGSEPSGRF
jgi:hypothetical protein